MEEVTDRSYEELVAERIFSPLKMKGAIFGFAGLIDADEPVRHIRLDGSRAAQPLARTDRPFPSFLSPAGNISLSISDLAKFLVFQLRGLNGADKLISSRLVRRLHTPIVPSGEDEHYAMGWVIRRIGKQTVSNHLGSDQTMYALISINKSTNVAVGVLTNVGGVLSEMAMANIALEVLHWQLWSSRFDRRLWRNSGSDQEESCD